MAASRPPGPPPEGASLVSLMIGVETRNSVRSGTSNSWMTVPNRPEALSRTTILAWYPPGRSSKSQMPVPANLQLIGSHRRASRSRVAGSRFSSMAWS